MRGERAALAHRSQRARSAARARRAPRCASARDPTARLAAAVLARRVRRESRAAAHARSQRRPRARALLVLQSYHSTGAAPAGAPADEAVRAGVSVCHLLQQPGTFVITWPRAYHAGFSHGVNCAESSNFATPDWVQHARVANERYRRSGRLAVISHDRLMFTLRANEGRDTIDGQARRILREELRRLVVEDLKLRDAAYASGVRDISKLCTPPAFPVVSRHSLRAE